MTSTDIRKIQPLKSSKQNSVNNVKVNKPNNSKLKTSKPKLAINRQVSTVEITTKNGNAAISRKSFAAEIKVQK